MNKNTINLFVDDSRIPDKEFVHVKTFNEAIHYLVNYSVNVLSLDHDLGDYNGNNEKTGYDIVQWIEEKVVVEGFTPPKTIKVHSGNPVGRKNMEQAIESIQRRT